jgi:hypothetical protein
MSVEKGMPFDISCPPRKIEVKSFGRSASGDFIALEDRQYQAARADPENFYIYVVDNVSGVGGVSIGVRVLHGARLTELLNRAVPNITYWPTFRAADYDRISEGIELRKTNCGASQRQPPMFFGSWQPNALTLGTQPNRSRLIT